MSTLSPSKLDETLTPESTQIRFQVEGNRRKFYGVSNDFRHGVNTAAYFVITAAAILVVGLGYPVLALGIAMVLFPTLFFAQKFDRNGEKNRIQKYRTAVGVRIASAASKEHWDVDGQAVTHFKHRTKIVREDGVIYRVSNSWMEKSGEYVINLLLDDHEILDTRKEQEDADRDKFFLQEVKTKLGNKFDELSIEEAYILGTRRNR